MRWIYVMCLRGCGERKIWWNIKNFQNIMKMIVVNIYLFKANNRKTFLILWRRSGVFMVNFEHILHFFLVFLQLPLKSKSYVGSEIQFCLKSYPSCVYLFKVQKEQNKYQNKEWNLIKVKKKDTWTTSVTSSLCLFN